MQYKQGDLVTLFKQGEFDIIAHQCNCFSVMGGGIARQLAKEFPIIEQSDKLNKIPNTKYATNQYCSTEYGIIVNMYSQFEPGGCNDFGIDSFYVRLGALKTCLSHLNKTAVGRKIGLPLVGSGIGADIVIKKKMGDLQYFVRFIGPTIKEYLPNLDVTIVYL